MADNYEIRIKGRIGEEVVQGFEGLTATTEPVETILYGPVPDPGALLELLTELQSFGMEMVELRRLPGEAS